MSYTFHLHFRLHFHLHFHHPLAPHTNIASCADGATGAHSVHTVEYGKEIMFHVSTLLPYSRENRQQLERKRHLGNDICNIVFYDGPSEAFDPSMIRSQFNHIFIVVSRTANSDYSLKVYTKATVPEFGPALPNPAIFKDPNELRRFLIVKLLNGEKSALSSPMTSFAKKKERTLEALISDICSDTKLMTTRKTSRRGGSARDVDDFRAKGQVGNAVSRRRRKRAFVFGFPPSHALSPPRIFLPPPGAQGGQNCCGRGTNEHPQRERCRESRSLDARVRHNAVSPQDFVRRPVAQRPGRRHG
jgi:hypothetical protein